MTRRDELLLALLEKLSHQAFWGTSDHVGGFAALAAVRAEMEKEGMPVTAATGATHAPKRSRRQKAPPVCRDFQTVDGVEYCVQCGHWRGLNREHCVDGVLRPGKGA